MKRFLGFLTLLGVLLMAAGGFGLYRLRLWAEQARALDEPVLVEFPRGTRLVDLSESLEERGVVDHAVFFHLYVKFFSRYETFQAGTYRFEKPTSPLTLIQTLQEGRTYVPVVVQFTIPEGFTMKQIAERMAAHGVGDVNSTLRMMRDAALAQALGVKSKTLEGYLYPATYSFTYQPDSQTVIKEMVKTFFSKLPADLESRLSSRGLTLQQGVIFASLIELETKYDDEKPKVSEVIWRRLKEGMPLGIDAAIIYGIKDYRGDLTWKHLKDDKNLYNTRLHKGLPPGPIGNPSLSSLEAVLNPTEEGYYFYVLTPGGEERHHFSRSLSEHNTHVKLLLEASKLPKRNSPSKAPSPEDHHGK